MKDYRAKFEQYSTYTTEKLEKMRANRVEDLEIMKAQRFEGNKTANEKAMEKEIMDELRDGIDMIDMVLAER